jgi:hypothetical protein
MAKEYSFAKCRCDIGYVLQNYVKPLMQTLSNDVKDYYLKMITTKCLNTAIMLGIFMIGYKKTKAIADYCDTEATRQRHLNNIDDNPTIFKNFKTDILKKTCRTRYFYYIMLTDGHFPKLGGVGTIYFPGHVFIIEKMPPIKKGELPYFYLFQSYINQYDLNGHIKKTGNNVRLTYDKMTLLLEHIDYILETEIWDDKCVEKWRDFTFVDTSNTFKGTKSKGNFFFCFKKTPVQNCLAYIRKYTKLKLKEVTPKIKTQAHEIYGKSEIYDKNIQPLSNLEMYKQLSKLHEDIKNKALQIKSSR